MRTRSPAILTDIRQIPCRYVAFQKPRLRCRGGLLSLRDNAALKGSLATEQVGVLAFKGLTQPVVAFNVPPEAIQPAPRVIEGEGPLVFEQRPGVPS